MPALTIAYASPETLLHNRPSHTSDLYSLAITYVDLRTGALPFRSETLPGVTRAIAKGDLDLTRLSPPEQSVIRRAAAFDPNRRYQSAVEMVKDLRAAVEDKKTVRSPLSKRRKLSFAVAGVILALTGALVWTLAPNEGGDGGGGNDAPTSMERQNAARAKMLLDRGTKYLDAKEYAKAIDDLSVVIDLRQDDPRPLSRRGFAHLQLDHFKEAIADYAKALEIEDDAGDHYGRGTAYFRLGHLPEALADFDRGSELASDDPKLKSTLEKWKALTLEEIRSSTEPQKGDDGQ